MEITVQLPDDIVKQLGDIESMSRQLLESFAIEGYRSESLTCLATVKGVRHYRTK